jgi:hypothetical protein
VTAESLLDRLTAKPPLAAGEFRVTVQLSVPAAAIDPLTQVMSVNIGRAVPVWPDAFNCKAKVSATPPALAVRVAVCAVLTEETAAVKLAVVDPACTVTEFGTVTAESLLDRLTAKPPLAAAAFRMTVQLSVPAPAIDPLTQVMPVNPGRAIPVWPDAFNCKANVSATPPALAVRVAVCAVLTEETAAVKLAIVDPAGTVTEVGTVTAESLLDRLTAKPPVAAAEFNATVQLSSADPVVPSKAQLSDVNSTLVVALAAVPVPLSPTTRVPSAVALLAIIN